MLTGEQQLARLVEELQAVVEHYADHGPVGHRAGLFIRRRGRALLQLARAVQSAAVGKVTHINAMPPRRTPEVTVELRRQKNLDPPMGQTVALVPVARPTPEAKERT